SKQQQHHHHQSISAVDHSLLQNGFLSANQQLHHHHHPQYAHHAHHSHHSHHLHHSHHHHYHHQQLLRAGKLRHFTQHSADNVNLSAAYQSAFYQASQTFGGKNTHKQHTTKRIIII